MQSYAGLETDEAAETAAKIKQLHEEEGFAYEEMACLFRVFKGRG